MYEIVLVKDLMDDAENGGDVKDLEQPGTAQVPEGDKVIL